MASLLEVADLTTRFHTPEGTVYAVNGVGFGVRPGETLAVVGESGCGKSVSMLSVLRLIAIPPGEIVAGRAVFDGRDLLGMTEGELEAVRGKDISMVFQDPMTSLNPVLTIGRQLTEALRVHCGAGPAEARQRAADMLSQVGIPDAASRLEAYPHQFSGGMRQRVMIAMALSCDPRLVIADEPTTALDVTIQAQIIELVIRLRQQRGLAVIWITHDLGVVASLADRVSVMYAGFIVEEADVDRLYDEPRHPYTLALLAALPRIDQRRRARLRPIQGSPPSLMKVPRGCPFAPRCGFVLPRCRQENPTLRAVSPGQRVACWVDTHSGRPI